MNFSVNLRRARESAGLTQQQVADEIGISKSTYCNYEIGKREPDVEKIKKIAKALKISCDVLLETGFDSKKAPSLSGEAMKLAKDYEGLDIWGRQAVRAVADAELTRMEDEASFEAVQELVKEPKIIPLYCTPAAAGFASPVFGEDYEPFELGSEDPQGAEFAIRLQGDSMEPAFADGSVVFCNRDPLADGDIGIFVVDGESVCKQYHYDRALGMTYLFSLNRKRAEADIVIPRSSNRYVVCMGRVITGRRFALPGL